MASPPAASTEFAAPPASDFSAPPSAKEEPKGAAASTAAPKNPLSGFFGGSESKDYESKDFSGYSSSYNEAPGVDDEYYAQQ